MLAGTVDILLISECITDALFICQAIEQSRVKHRLHTAVDGESAVDYLYLVTSYFTRLKVDFVLLDLGLKTKRGFELLSSIKSDERLKDIPVVVLTDSTDEKHINSIYQLQANSCVVKPFDLDEFNLTISSAIRFWADAVKPVRAKQK